MTDAARARRVQQLQLRRYFPHKEPGRDFAPFTDAELGRAAVYRLSIAGWSAKRNAEAPNCAGAFLFPWTATPGRREPGEVRRDPPRGQR